MRIGISPPLPRPLQRLAETNTGIERERQAETDRLRRENSTLTARLTQAQHTLDQIAAARLGTPAAGIAAGGGGAPAPCGRRG